MVLLVGVDHARTIALATEAYTLFQVGSASGRVLETPPRHMSLATRGPNLAGTYWNQGRWNEAEAAEQLEVQVMDMRKKLLGADHPDTLGNMGNLASTYLHLSPLIR